MPLISCHSENAYYSTMSEKPVFAPGGAGDPFLQLCTGGSCERPLLVVQSCT